MVKISFINIVLLAVAFMCLLVSFITLANSQRYLLQIVHVDGQHFISNGYISLGVVYAAFSLSNLVVPFIHRKIGSRLTMFIGSCLHLFYQIQFHFSIGWLLYLGSALCGFGGGLLWTAHGRYLYQNSTRDSLNRNCYIFWIIMQSGRISGNLYVYFGGFDSNPLTKYQKHKLFGTMTGLCGFSCFILFILREAVYRTPNRTDVLQTIQSTIKLSYQKDMLLLVITFIYSGLQMSFYTGVYSSAIGFTKAFKCVCLEYIALSGLMVGIGIILAGSIFGILGYKTMRWGRFPVVIFGFFIHTVAYILIFLNLPDSASNAYTFENSVIKSDLLIALCCSFLLGFGDVCYITQIYGILNQVFIRNISQAHVIFRFVQGASTSIAYFYASFLGLHGILYILICFAVFGTINFCIAEFKYTKKIFPISKKEENSDRALLESIC